MACFGPMNSIGTFQAYLSTHQLQDQGPSAIGWIFSLYVFLSFFCGIQIGPIFDEKGPRLLVLAGSVLILATMFLVGVCTEYWHFVIVWGVLGGFGTALIFTPAVACIGHYFCVRRATATGIAATGGSLGGIVFPLMLESLIPKIGFAWATRVLGFIFLLLTVIANALIRSRLPPNSRVSFRPDFKIFRDSSFVLTTLGVFLIEWALFVPLSYISSYALDNGIDSTFSYQLLAVLNVGSFFGRWLPGYVADKVGRFNTMIVTVTLCLITTLSLWLPAGGSTAMLVVFAAVYGFASGSNISLTPVCVGQLCDTAEYGRYYATCYTIASFGTLTGIPIAGQILSANDGKYWGLIILTGMCYAGGLAAFIAARIVTVGWRITAVF
ncbi:MAG: hypothetical protein M1832_004967 [Thelocarpon impressellum]|nr:MAG: hypothetical protein M1832_004967 [Thelocarpon impressellum]